MSNQDGVDADDDLREPDDAKGGEEEHADKLEGDDNENKEDKEDKEEKDSDDEDEKKDQADPDAEPPAPIDVEGETKRVIED